MKRYLTVLAIALTSLLGLSTSVKAQKFRVGYTSYYTAGYADCGCAIPGYKVFRGYSSRRHPIWTHFTSPIQHSCRHFTHRTYRHSVSRPIRNSRYQHRRYGNRRSRGHLLNSSSYYGNSAYGHKIVRPHRRSSLRHR